MEKNIPNHGEEGLNSGGSLPSPNLFVGAGLLSRKLSRTLLLTILGGINRKYNQTADRVGHLNPAKEISPCGGTYTFMSTDMIVEPDFFDHWRTRMVVEAVGDECGPIYIQRLWAHCQVRRSDEFSIPTGGLKALCKFPGDAAALESALVDAGFLERQGDRVKVLKWAEYNSGLLASWENGRKGGRPKKNPEETKRLPSGNQAVTQTEPVENQEVTQAKPPENPDGTDKTTIRSDQTKQENTNSRACENESENAIAQKPADFDPLKAQNEAKRLAKLYVERTKCPHSNAGCEGAIYALLNAQIASTSILEAAIDGYAEDPKRKNADSKYTLSGRKFFGEGGWEEYKDGKDAVVTEVWDRAKFIRERDERFERLKRESDARREENRIADEAFRKIYGVEKSIMNMVAVKAGTLKPLAEKEVEVKSA